MRFLVVGVAVAIGVAVTISEDFLLYHGNKCEAIPRGVCRQQEKWKPELIGLLEQRRLVDDWITFALPPGIIYVYSPHAVEKVASFSSN